ncbi:MAG: PH domain-containing protein [Candidatus Helarchaeota archaeon]
MEEQESSLWESHPFFWKYFYWIVLAYFFFLIVLIAAIWIYIFIFVSLIAFVILAVPALLQYFRWYRIYYRITDKRVTIRIGIFKIDEKNIMVEKIENYWIERTLIDRLFDTGDIIFHTEGEAMEGDLKDVPRIHTVEKILTDLLSK